MMFSFPPQAYMARRHTAMGVPLDERRRLFLARRQANQALEGIVEKYGQLRFA
ncbi:hypothetical protein [Pseudomonas sp. PA15(2017)]|uniref:hypothetical protein n=1 Tax=Pseudomonas sp. PA15(2017) TaxID=1932111 RepID=UPI00143C64F7|nr:hypothetical protein [Pseudomonas sp. PA15(2017)]